MEVGPENGAVLAANEKDIAFAANPRALGPGRDDGLIDGCGFLRLGIGGRSLGVRRAVRGFRCGLGLSFGCREQLIHSLFEGIAQVVGHNGISTPGFRDDADNSDFGQFAREILVKATSHREDVHSFHLHQVL